MQGARLQGLKILRQRFGDIEYLRYLQYETQKPIHKYWITNV